MDDVLIRFKESIADVLRLLVPGLFLLVLLSREYLTVVDPLSDGTEPLWLWIFVFAWVAALHDRYPPPLLRALSHSGHHHALRGDRARRDPPGSAQVELRGGHGAAPALAYRGQSGAKPTGGAAPTLVGHLLWMVGKVLFVVSTIRYLSLLPVRPCAKGENFMLCEHGLIEQRDDHPKLREAQLRRDSVGFINSIGSKRCNCRAAAGSLDEAVCIPAEYLSEGGAIHAARQYVDRQDAARTRRKLN